MHWILQNNFMYERGWDRLVLTLERFNIPYSIHKVIPFIGELEPAFTEDRKDVICIGSYSMRHYARKMNFNPGVFDLFEQNFNVQMEHWGKFMLNADSKVQAFKDVKITEPSFLRPIDDSKYFTGKVFDSKEFSEWQFKVVDLKEDDGTSLTGDTLVQVSKPKTIYQEVRFWIVDDEVITQSLYKRGNQVIYSREQVDDRFKAFAAALCSRMSVDYWCPAKAYVVDICETDEGLKIVELNTINSAGFYDGDVSRIVFALNSHRIGELIDIP